MIDLSFLQGYWYMFMQVAVTLVIVPMIVAKRFNIHSNLYCLAFYPEAKKVMQAYNQRWLRVLFATTTLCFCVAFAIVLHAQIRHVELLNWDNQAGLMVLFMLAMIPVIGFVLVQKGLFSLFKSFNSTRNASLKQARWQSFFSTRLVMLLIGGQFIFVGTVGYFVNHPFDGFAGYSNLLGLAILNIVFSLTCYAIYNSKKMATIKDPAQRVVIKRKAMKFNLVVWIVAVYYLSTSLWIAGVEDKTLSLLAQSAYLQLLIILTTFAALLPYVNTKRV